MLAIAYLIPAVVILIIHKHNMTLPEDSRVLCGVIHYLCLMIILPLTCLLYTGTSIQKEVACQTLTYLFTRPLARPLILLSIYFVHVTVIMICFTMGVIVSGFLSSWWVPVHPLILIIWFGGLLAILGYGALFLLLGLFFRRPLIVGAIYLAIAEWILSNVPAVVQKASLIYYIRSIIYSTKEVQENLWAQAILPVFQPVGIGVGFGVLAGFILVALGLACFTVSRREFAIVQEV